MVDPILYTGPLLQSLLFPMCSSFFSPRASCLLCRSTSVQGGYFSFWTKQRQGSSIPCLVHQFSLSPPVCIHIHLHHMYTFSTWLMSVLLLCFQLSYLFYYIINAYLMWSPGRNAFCWVVMNFSCFCSTWAIL